MRHDQQNNYRYAVIHVDFGASANQLHYNKPTAGGPDNKETYPVTRVVDTETGAVALDDGNALRVKAQLMQ